MLPSHRETSPNSGGLVSLAKIIVKEFVHVTLVTWCVLASEGLRRQQPPTQFTKPKTTGRELYLKTDRCQRQHWEMLPMLIQ